MEPGQYFLIGADNNGSMRITSEMFDTFDQAFAEYNRMLDANTMCKICKTIYG